MGTPEVGPLGLHSLLVRAGDYVGNLAGTTDKAPYRQLRAWGDSLQVFPLDRLPGSPQSGMRVSVGGPPRKNASGITALGGGSPRPGLGPNPEHDGFAGPLDMKSIKQGAREAVLLATYLLRQPKVRISEQTD